MKKIIITILLLVSLPSFAQLVPQWRSQMGLPLYSGGNPRGMVLDDSSNVYLLDNVVNFGDARTDCIDPVLHKLNKNGETIWIRNFGAVPCWQEDARCLKMDNENNLLALCQTADTLNNIILTYVVKANRNGDILWKTNLGNAINFFDSKLEISSSGFIYVSIKNTDFNSNYENKIFKISSSGLKTDSIKVSHNGTPVFIYDFKILSDTKIYILYYTSSDSTYISLVDTGSNVQWTSKSPYFLCSKIGKDSSIIAANAERMSKFNINGELKWTKLLYGSNPGSFNGNSIEPKILLTRDDNIIYAGCAPITAQTHTFLVSKLNSQTGDSIWSFKLNSTLPSNSMLTDIAMDSSGNFYACGLILPTNYQNGNTYGIIKLSSQGNLLRTTLNNNYINLFMMPYYISVTNDNSIIMEGFYDGTIQYEQSLTIKYSQPVNITPSGNSLPDKFSLKQNYPNPFNPNTVIGFQLPVAGFVTVKIYDINGREISELVNEKLSAGEYKIDFNGASLPSGVYYYKMTTENFSETKKMILIK
ncbi:MAG: T9SS type A sorting domain-containing protein [Bacteroidetes bacterium]|nr:T9SS type A sorting domain-containing protein [Bacteroidota bacterium]